MTTVVSAGAFMQIYDPSVGEAEPWYINDHTIVRARDGTWHLIGITHEGFMSVFDEKHLAHAAAPSLHGPWTKQPYALSADEAAGETVLWAPHVVEHDDRYWMFVCGGGDDWNEWRIHLATSDDCVTWTRHPENPMLVDGHQARDPMVLWVGDRWVMYYTATSEASGGSHIVAARESDDLVHWSGRHIVYSDELVGHDAGPTESPFVFERDGHWYLFMGPSKYGEMMQHDSDWIRANWKAVYSSTLVLESDDPLRFDRANEVGLIAAHASEIVVDVDGSTWITHCGWGEGGVYLAPLRWGDA